MPRVIHHLPTGRSLTPRFLTDLHLSVREEHARGVQVWVAAGHGPVLYPRSLGYRLVAVEGPTMVFRSAHGQETRRTAVAVTPPRPQRAAA